VLYTGEGNSAPDKFRFASRGVTVPIEQVDRAAIFGVAHRIC